jgi:hypothetical protein
MDGAGLAAPMKKSATTLRPARRTAKPGNPLDTYDEICNFGSDSKPVALAFSPENELVVFRATSQPRPITLRNSVKWYAIHQSDDTGGFFSDSENMERWLLVIAEHVVDPSEKP